MQVYRGMDIGTAKPTPDDRRRIPHYLIDIADPAEEFTVAEFQREGRGVLAALAETSRPAVIAGGSGLHFRALVDPLTFAPHDPDVRARIDELPDDVAVNRLRSVDPSAGRYVDLANPRRVQRALEIYELSGATPSQRAASDEAAAVRAYRAQIPVRAVGFDPGGELEARIAARVDGMLARGLLDEVAALAPRLGRTARNAVGYRQLLEVVGGTATVEEGRREVVRATTALAKRQRTFFARDPRIRWLPWSPDPDERAAAAHRALEEAGSWTS